MILCLPMPLPMQSTEMCSVVGLAVALLSMHCGKNPGLFLLTKILKQLGPHYCNLQNLSGTGCKKVKNMGLLQVEIVEEFHSMSGGGWFNFKKGQKYEQLTCSKLLCNSVAAIILWKDLSLPTEYTINVILLILILKQLNRRRKIKE
jgi:hypothetical protein